MLILCIIKFFRDNLELLGRFNGKIKNCLDLITENNNKVYLERRKKTAFG